MVLCFENHVQCLFSFGVGWLNVPSSFVVADYFASALNHEFGDSATVDSVDASGVVLLNPVTVGFAVGLQCSFFPHIRFLLFDVLEVVFEKETLSSLDDSCEMMLTMFASFAQEESHSISENVKWE